MDSVFHLQALILNLKEEALFAEKVAIETGRRPRRVIVPFHQPLGHFALQTSGKPDQPPRMLSQKFLAHPRLVVEAMQRGFRRDLHQVAVAFFIFGQHQQVVISVAVGWSASDDVVVFLADIEFASHDRFHANLMRGIYKMHRAKNIAVIGHGDRRHAKVMNPVNKFLDVASAIEQGVITMKMQVDELILAHEDLSCSYGGSELLEIWNHSNGWK